MNSLCPLALPDNARASLKENSHPDSLMETLYERYVKPISKEANDIAHGIPPSEDTPMSAIFYGPPGTSKTSLAKEIAKYLCWPLLTVNPSYFIKNGVGERSSEVFVLAVTDGRSILFCQQRTGWNLWPVRHIIRNAGRSGAGRRSF